MIGWVSLHTHSDASLKDGLGPVANLIARAVEIGQESIALTDHGTLANAVAFTIECERQGIKPILGLEGYVAVDGIIGHFTLLADGQKGWENIVTLNNLGHASAFKEPAFTFDQLLEHSEDVVLLTGCPASPLNTLPWERALELGRQLKLTFKDRLFAEVSFVGDMATYERPINLAHALKLPIVATNDVHFASREDAPIHTVLTKIKAGFSYNSVELYLKTPREIAHQAQRLMGKDFDLLEVSKWIKNSVSIARHIRPVKLVADQKLPRFDGAKDLIIKTALGGLRYYGLSTDKKYQDRLNFELEVIEKMHYFTYFAILKDIVQYARDQGVRIGAGRGSGAGSLVLWCLGITDIDPIKHNLSFERFLNPERKGMPDVDLDFDSEMRQVVLDYAAKKWKAKPIATYSRYQHKSLVHELGKFFLVNKALETTAAELGPDSKEFRMICETRPEFEHAYDLILNQIRHKGKHAGGVVITNAIVPIERTGSELSVAWTEGMNSELSYAGLVKFDLLGVSALSILRRLEAHHDFDYDPEKHPEVFDIFKSGNLAGIFQFAGSSGIHDLTVKLQPNKFEDLVAINALYRPGALDAGTCDLYPTFKSKPRKVPELFADVLEETYGVIVYQEQLMTIIQRALGGSFAGADLARRIITKGGKKTSDPVHLKQLNDLRVAVITGFESHMTATEAAKWWGELETHGMYSFNKSHSTGYATIAWQMAYWKYYEPANFYAECLNIDTENSQDYIMSAVSEGIQITRPDINIASWEWLGCERIILPLSALRFLSVDVAKTIVKNRPEGGYVSIKQFCELNPKKILRAQAREGLWYMGAFGKLPGTVKDLQLPDKTRPALTPSETMQKYLGFIVPTLAQYRRMQEHLDAGYTVGIVHDRKLRKSSYGPYVVYYLSPTGVFWSRETTDIQEGQIVAFKTTGKGRAKEIVRLST